MQFVDILPANINGANTLSAAIQQVATALGITVVALFVRTGTWLSDALFTKTDLGYSVALQSRDRFQAVPAFHGEPDI